MKTNKSLISVIILLFLTLSLGSFIVNIYTDWLFFLELDYKSVFLQVISTQLLLGLVFFLASLTFVAVNLIIAHRTSFPSVELFFDGQTRVSLNIEQLAKWIKPLSFILGILFSLFVGLWGSSLWREFLLFRHRMNVNLNDPLFNQDISFYLFILPFFDYIKSYAGFVIFTTLFIVFLNYLLRGGIVLKERFVSVDKKVKQHLGILGGLFLIAISFGFYLDRFHLLYSSEGLIFGAGYTDVHSRLLALWALFVVTFLSGIFFLFGLAKSSWKTIVFPLGAIGIIYIVGFTAYPSLLQNFRVAPNELALEKEFIEHHIKFTRFGYDLDRIDVRPFDVSYDLTSDDIKNNNATIKNIRLWDDTPLLRTYSQLQQIRTYYSFKDVDNDRYTINGEYMQVMMSPRELSYDDLPSRSWINEKIVFTHGSGLALGPVSRISGEGLPEFIIKDIPPVSTSDLSVVRPEIYFGELSNDYVIVKTKVPEFDYPTSEGNVYTTYDGNGGVQLSSFFRKAMFALKFKSEKILLSSDITSESRILFIRNIIERARKIAPFLVFDTDPYIVVTDSGRLLWIIDAYTVSKNIPYSNPFNKRLNYIRNSVKAVIDAYDGSVTFYISDPDDILMKVYKSIFPDLFRPLQDMDEDIRKHIRYPKGYLQVQASMYSTFHMTDPKIFYNKEDLWEIPAYGDRSLEPYYTVMKLPEEKKEEYILLLPYTPSKRDNLAAWLAGRCDEPHYGKLIVYTFPRDRLVFGPRQIDARIDQDSYISQQLTLWGQRGSQVIRGSLLIIPIEKSLLYVQPLYLAAEDKGGLPELRRVILAYENEVVMEDNLELGLQQLFGGKVRISQKISDSEDKEPSFNDLAQQARQTYDKLLQLQRQGDWAGYGEQLKRLGQILKKMKK